MTFESAVIDRFISKLRQTDYGCIEFTGCTNTTGHGTFRVGSRYMYAHRIAWLLAGKVITDEAPCILHKCNNPICCNVDHLYAGTRADNAIDRAALGVHWTSVSGYGTPPGISRLPSRRFRVRMQIGFQRKQIGIYNTIDEAVEALRIAREELCRSTEYSIKRK